MANVIPIRGPNGDRTTRASRYFDAGTLSAMIAEELEIGGETRTIVRDRILSRALQEFPGNHTHHTISSGMTYVLGRLSEQGYIVDSFWKITE